MPRSRIDTAFIQWGQMMPIADDDIKGDEFDSMSARMARAALDAERALQESRELIERSKRARAADIAERTTVEITHRAETERQPKAV
jgi:hypothetical protein